MKAMESGWTKDKWLCEDCGTTGEDWGTPEACPKCGSADTRPIDVERELRKAAFDG